MKLTRQLALVLGVTACLVGTANAQLTMTDVQEVANAVVVTYDPLDGNLSVNGNGVNMTTIELKSAGEMFRPENVNDGIISPPFDVATNAKLFTLKTAGFGSLDFGAVYPTDMTGEMVMADMAVAGSILPSGGLSDAAGAGPYLYVVPEPASAGLILCGLLGLIGLRRK